MKELKALEILKKDRRIITHVDGISLDEAIAELEALLEPKSCDLCDNYSEDYKQTEVFTKIYRNNAPLLFKVIVSSPNVTKGQIVEMLSPKVEDGMGYFIMPNRWAKYFLHMEDLQLLEPKAQQ